MNTSYSPEGKRVAVIGSAGRLGAHLSHVLERKHDVIRLARPQIDLADPASIAAALEPLDYDMAVITGALTAVDHCEKFPEMARAINAEAAGQIAAISARKGAHVTYISTDMVYDGLKGTPYSETDAANPISVYGATKLWGEELVMQASPDNLVIRISWVFGPGKAAFPEWIINKCCEESTVTLPGDKIACPTSCVDLAYLMLLLLFGESGRTQSGVFNLCNASPCTWREWGQFCIDTARAAGLPVLAGEITGVPVDSVEAFVARRPVNSAMSTEKFSAITGVQPRHWQSAVKDFLTDSDLFRRYRELVSAGTL